MRHSLLHRALDRVIPAPCPGCGLTSRYGVFCNGCAEEWLEQTAVHCSACGQTMASDRFPENRCPDCRARPPHCRKLYFVADYTGPHAVLIRRYKYQKDLTLTRPLATLLATRLRTDLSELDCITWMPLHSARKRLRGFNQAERLARAIGHLVRLPVRNLLLRPEPTPPLEGMSRPERLDTLDRAIRARRQAKGTCLVIDDVYTTGASLNAAAKALLDAGATEVRAGVLGRTPLTEDSRNSWMSRVFGDIPGEAPVPDSRPRFASRR